MSNMAFGAYYTAWHYILYMDLSLLLLISGKQKLGISVYHSANTRNMFLCAMSTM